MRQQSVSPEIIKSRLLSEFSPKLHCLFEHHPYKIAWSGRYSAKSWSFSAAILELGIEKPLRIVCLRETMKSIQDSVHALMRDQVNRLGLSQYYRAMDQEIRGTNGTSIFYAHLRGNAANVKSMEGCDIFWVEEAQGVSKDSWETLIPTVRKEGAELWISMNPYRASDDSYRRWIQTPPPGAKVIALSWRDNKYLTEDIAEKMRHLYATDPEAYQHIWEGSTVSTVQDAVYKAQIQFAEKNGQFRRVPYDARKPVDTYWDLGYGDMVSIWFAQSFPFEVRILDYYDNSHQNIDHYLQVMQSKGYVYGECVLPWDSASRHVSTGRSTLEVIKSKGFKARALRQGLVSERIDTLRTRFPQMYFDAAKCEQGIEHLRNYQWGPPSASGTLKREPLHDSHSHAADALGYMAVALSTPPAGKQTTTPGTGSRTLGGALAGFR